MTLEETRYFDHAASSPATPACLEAMAAYAREPWAGANPNSLHSFGRKAFEALEGARARLARLIGARRPSEFVFTSGGTESNNAAVVGIARAVLEKSRGGRNRVLVSAFEHDSVLDPAHALTRGGDFRIELVPVTGEGLVDLEALGSLLGPDVALVSVMGANNEVGTVQPVAEVARLAHAAGALAHTDAVQTFGHVPFDAAALGVDAATFAAHKIGGPVGIGGLYLKARTPFIPTIVGGGQETGLRSGTQDVRGALAFAAVAEDACTHLAERSACVSGLAGLLVELCCRGEGACARETVPAPRDERFLPGLLHLLVPGHQSEGLVLALDDAGFEVSGGSACSSSSLEPSHVLLAMGVPRDLAFCSLRLSFDHRTTERDCRDLAAALRRVCSTPKGEVSR